MKILVTALVTAAVTAGAAFAASANGRLFHAQYGDTFLAGKKILCFYAFQRVTQTPGVECGLRGHSPLGYLSNSHPYAISDNQGVLIIVGGKTRYVCRFDGHCVTK